MSDWDELFAAPPKKEEKKVEAVIKPEVKVEAKPTVQVEQPKQEVAVEQTSTSKSAEDVFVEQTPKPEVKQVPKGEFQFEEAEPLPIEVITIFGEKGVGKTKAALGMPGTVACLSFDKQSAPIKALFYHNDKRIRVWDAIRYLDETSPLAVGESNEKTFKYIIYLLDQIKETGGADWVVLDGSEVVNQICEQVMRVRNSLMPNQGITNRNLWKERNMYMRQIHRKAVDCARKGVIYTTYVENRDIFKEGEIDTTLRHPKWVDITLRETSVVIFVESVPEKSGLKFYATIVSSKSPLFKTGARYDITDKNLSEVLGIK